MTKDLRTDTHVTNSTRLDGGFILRSVDISAVSDEAHGEYLTFNNQIRAESDPQDPPRTLVDQISRWRNVPPIITIHNWEVRDTKLSDCPLIGWGEMQIGQQETNQNVALFRLAVLPERRREGIGRRLLQPLASTAMEQNRTLLIGTSLDHIPASERFFEALGAERGMKSVMNQLALSELDPTALRAYREESERRGKGAFELLRADSPIPEELLPSITDLLNQVMDDVPHDDLAMEPEQLTPEQMRLWEQSALASDNRFLILVGRDRGGKLAGMTMMTWRKHLPYLVEQGITGVLSEYRGNGLARCLKATMLEQLMTEYPEVQFVRTDNANSNAGMLAINRALGFRPYRSETLWQIPTERILAYLARPSVSTAPVSSP